MRAAIFVERDGILVCDRVEKDQPVPPLILDEMQPKPEAIEPLRELKAAGYLIIATTNQPGLSRGTLSRRELDRMHSILRPMFHLDDILLCPHDAADCCPCRKPKAGLLTEAAFTHKIHLQHSFVISNKWQDAQAAHTAGCTSLLISSPWIGKGHRDIVLPNVSEMAQKILQLRRPARTPQPLVV